MHIKLYAKGGVEPGNEGPEAYTIFEVLLIFHLLNLWCLISFIHLRSCFVCLFTILCILCFCICCVAPPLVYSCLFPVLHKSTDRCHRIETQLQ